MSPIEIVKEKSPEECKAILSQVAKFFNEYPSYLSYKSDYAKGYKDAWYLAYDNIWSILKNS